MAITGCAPAIVGIPPRETSIEGIWQVIEVKRQATPQAGDYRITFDNGRLGARFGCNHMGGQYRRAGNQLIAEHVTSTLMGCPEPAATIERDAGFVLAQPMSISWISADQLELSNRAGGIKLTKAR
ncbi:MAG TPA: META domain-containing protein [Sphingomicrobium sp.]